MKRLFCSIGLVLLLADGRADAATNWIGPPRPLTLEEAYDRTLATDQNIKIAFAEIKKRELLPWSALTRVGPQITANGAFNKPERTLAGTQGPVLQQNWRGDITVQQPLIDPTVFAAYRGAKLSAQAARLAHQFTMRQVLFGVTRAYYDALKQARLVSVNQQTLALAGLGIEQNRQSEREVRAQYWPRLVA